MLEISINELKELLEGLELEAKLPVSDLHDDAPTDIRDQAVEVMFAAGKVVQDLLERAYFVMREIEGDPVEAYPQILPGNVPESMMYSTRLMIANLLNDDAEKSELPWQLVERAEVFAAEMRELEKKMVAFDFRTQS